MDSVGGRFLDFSPNGMIVFPLLTFLDEFEAEKPKLSLGVDGVSPNPAQAGAAALYRSRIAGRRYSLKARTRSYFGA